MKLKTYNKTNTLTKDRGTPAISITHTGVFRVSTVLAEEMKLQEGDQVALAQDEDEPKDWYLHKVKADGFPIHISGGGHVFSALGITRQMMELIEFKHKTGRMIVGEKITHDKVQMWPLILSSLKNTARKKATILLALLLPFASHAQTITYDWPNQPCANTISCVGGCTACNAPDNSSSFFTGTAAVWHGLSPCPMANGGGDCAVYTDGWLPWPDTSRFILISLIAWSPVWLDSVIIEHHAMVGGPGNLRVNAGINTTLPATTYADVMTSQLQQTTVITDVGCIEPDSGMVLGFAQVMLQAYNGSGDWVLDRIRIVGGDCGQVGILEVRPERGSGDDQTPLFDLSGRAVRPPASGGWVIRGRRVILAPATFNGQ